MTTLCKLFFPYDLKAAMAKLKQFPAYLDRPIAGDATDALQAVGGAEIEEEEEEEEEEQEEEEEEELEEALAEDHT